MKYLVTGGAGFIGSHIVDALIERGHDVVVLDNLSSGHRENLTQVMDRISFIEGDVRDPETCLTAAEGCDGIFHEAALVSVADSIARPCDNHDINISGTLNILEAARTCGVKRVVVASSAAVYGNSPELPKHEEMLPEPMSPYAVAKITGEHYLRTYAELYGLEGVALRYFNVYGPRQDPSSPYSGVISIFAERVRQGLPVTIHGDGRQTRDFIHVADVVSANLLAMTMDFPAISNPQLQTANFSALNVATGKPHSLLELLGHLEEAAGKTVERSFAPVREGDIRHSVANISRMESTGWMPTVGFSSGLTVMLNKVSGS
jgi:UDP-glucose 4-epimerase